MNARRNDPIDPSLMNLDGALFGAVPRQVLPLETFRLESSTEPADEAAILLRRRPQDSLSPAAVEDAPAPARRSARAFFFVAAAGFAIVGAGVVHAASHDAPKAAALPAAAAVEAPAPALAATTALPAPAQAAPAAPEKAAPAAPEKAAPSPVKIAATPRAAHPAPAHPDAEAPAAPALALPAPIPPPASSLAAIADFDRSKASVAIAGAGQRAASCWDEEGTVNVPVTITFAPSGRVTSARITGGPLVGTSAGGCLAAALRGATVPAFAGDAVTVSTTIRLH